MGTGIEDDPDQPLRYDGFYFGLVEDTNDPDKLGRIRVRVGHVHPQDHKLAETEDLPWAEVVRAFGSNPNQGEYHVPSVGSQVVVMFSQGDPLYPLCLGTINGIASEIPTEVKGRAAGPASNNSFGTSIYPGSNVSGGTSTAPLVHVIKTASGHKVVADDNTDTPFLGLESAAGHGLTFDDESTRQRIELQSKGKHNLTFWDGTSGSPAKIEMTTILGHRMTFNDDSNAQEMTFLSKLGHIIQMADFGAGQHIVCRTLDRTEMKLNDKGSGGLSHASMRTRAGVHLDMIDSGDQLYLTTAGACGVVAIGSEYVGLLTSTGYRVDLGGVTDKVSITTPSGQGSMQILVGTTMTIHSDGDMQITSNGVITIKGTQVKINPP